MSDGKGVSELNREMARRINEGARNDPRSPVAGRLVGIIDGQLVAVDDDLARLIEGLHRIEADPNRILCFEAGLDYGQIEDIRGGS